MQNMLWSALNVVLFAGLVYIFFRAAKLVKQHIGWPAAVFFVVGLTIIASRPPSAIPGNDNLLPGIPQNTPLGNASTLKLVHLGSNNDLNLLAEYITSRMGSFGHGGSTPLYRASCWATLGSRLLECWNNAAHSYSTPPS